MNSNKTAKEKNTLVVLPTGTGKTLIAIMLSIERFKKYPLEKILISFKSKLRNFSITAFPKEPVPPVIKSVLL
jgi:hypothetical protein